MSTNEQTELKPAQEKAVFEAKEILASKEEALLMLGRIEGLTFVNKLTDVATLKVLQQLKESKAFRGLTYRNEVGAIKTIATWEECCEHKLGVSRANLDKKLLDLNVLGEAFFEATQRIGLGPRILNQVRRLPDEQREQVLEKALNDGADKAELKAFVTEMIHEAVEEKRAVEEKLEVANNNLDVTNKLLDETRTENDELKARKYKMKPWEKEVEEINFGIAEARLKFEQGLAHLSELADQIQVHRSFEDMEMIEGNDSLPASAVESISESLAEAAFILSARAAEFGGRIEAEFAVALETVLTRLNANMDEVDHEG